MKHRSPHAVLLHNLEKVEKAAVQISIEIESPGKSNI